MAIPVIKSIYLPLLKVIADAGDELPTAEVRNLPHIFIGVISVSSISIITRILSSLRIKRSTLQYSVLFDLSSEQNKGTFCSPPQAGSFIILQLGNLWLSMHSPMVSRACIDLARCSESPESEILKLCHALAQLGPLKPLEELLELA